MDPCVGAACGAEPEHHTVIVVGGGPAGLPMAVVLAGGWWPYYRRSAAFERLHPRLAGGLHGEERSLLALDFAALARSIRPVDLFNALHHPTERFAGLESLAMEFRRGQPLDCLLLSREPVGGLWNNVPRNLLTLSPGHWMELAFYPLAQWARETGRSLDPDALIVKKDLLEYYHSVPGRFGIGAAIRTDTDVTRIEPHPEGFLLSAATDAGEQRRYACRYLVYAAGQRCSLRRLGVPGEDLPFVTRYYDRPESFPGDRVLVVGGGRSADWAATELHDAGREVTYVMRQPRENHWRLISDSRAGLPYYARIAEIIESGSPRLRTLYRTRVQEIAADGTVTLACGERRDLVRVDRVLLEIGGEADYGLFQGFPPLSLVEKRDRYRYQCLQVVTHPHNYESLDIPRMYPGGYLAAGINNVVVAMHGATYAIAADILQREGIVERG
jgi:thioredoxin reductase